MRRILVAVLAALVVFACWWPLRGYPLPALDRWSNIPTLHAWFQGIVSTAPLSWLLVPFHWAVAPIFAADNAAFLRALPAALVLLVLHCCLRLLQLDLQGGGGINLKSISLMSLVGI